MDLWPKIWTWIYDSVLLKHRAGIAPTAPDNTLFFKDFQKDVNGEVAKFNVLESFQIDYPEHDVKRPWPQRQIMSHKYFLEVGSHAVGQDRARRGKRPSIEDVAKIVGDVLTPLSASGTTQ